MVLLLHSEPTCFYLLRLPHDFCFHRSIPSYVTALMCEQCICIFQSHVTRIISNMLNLEVTLRKQLQSSLTTAFKHVLSHFPDL